MNVSSILEIEKNPEGSLCLYTQGVYGLGGVGVEGRCEMEME